MPFRRRRIKRLTMGKDPIKHAHTLVSIHGNGSLVQEFEIILTNTGDRSLDGSTQVIQAEANTGKNVQISDIVKYVNIIIQSAATAEEEVTEGIRNGWIEWALVWRNEVDIPIPATNIGTLTLGVIANRMFRGDCLMSGQFPVAQGLPNIAELKVKLPSKAIKWKIGAELKLYFIFRDAVTTDVQTNTIKTVTSALFKAYS